jgi:hypothetical protein
MEKALPNDPMFQPLSVPSWHGVKFPGGISTDVTPLFLASSLALGACDTILVIR